MQGGEYHLQIWLVNNRLMYVYELKNFVGSNINKINILNINNYRA